MARVRLVQLGIALALGLSGCQWFGGGEESETVVVQPVPTATPNQPTRPGSTAASMSTLIQPTNPDERLRVIRGGRVDPFAALVPPGVPAPASSGGTANVGSATSLPSISGPANVGPPTTPANSSGPGTTVVRTGSTSAVARVPPVNRAQPGAPAPQGRSTASAGSSGAAASRNRSPGSQPGGSEFNSPGLSAPNNEVALPPLPQPDLAKGVQVSGFVVLNGVPRAIVKAPNERVSRSVVAGDLLANGQVQVKGIDFSNPNEPVLILEEAGTEVAVAAGKPAVQLASADETLPPIPALW